MGRTWCPQHFICNMEQCGRSLQETGFVEEKGEELYFTIDLLIITIF